MFQKKGSIIVAAGQKTPLSEDDLLSIILEAGADDMQAETDGTFSIVTSPQAFEPEKKDLEDKGIAVESASLQMVPGNTVKVTGKDAENVMKLMNTLEEHDDVQNVYSNFDIDDKELASFNS